MVQECSNKVLSSGPFFIKVLNIWKKSFFSLLEQGTIQLVSNETFIMNNQSYFTFKVERLQSLNGDAGVSWRLIYESNNLTKTSGRIQFEDGQIQQLITVPLDESRHDKPNKLELFNITNKYNLGSLKMTKISFVCKFYPCMNFCRLC